jgi:hypothetical protein
MNDAIRFVVLNRIADENRIDIRILEVIDADIIALFARGDIREQDTEKDDGEAFHKSSIRASFHTAPLSL